MKKYFVFKSNNDGDKVEKVHQEGLSFIEACKLASENNLSYCDMDLVEDLEFKYYSYRKC